MSTVNTAAVIRPCLVIRVFLRALATAVALAASDKRAKDTKQNSQRGGLPAFTFWQLGQTIIGPSSDWDAAFASGTSQSSWSEARPQVLAGDQPADV